MRIIIDAMGGDHAPEQIVVGALQSAKEFDIELALVGRSQDILDVMKAHGLDSLPKNVEIIHADDVVDMHADPADVVKQHKDSSLVQGLRLLADGAGDAFISAGNTGALLSAATLIVKRIRGIRRAAFAPILPVGRGAILVDAGANAECTPEFLLQFACMGSYYAKNVLDKQKPRVGLLNIGVEDCKGDALRKETYGLLKKADGDGLICFVGNVEAREVSNDAADVVVSDGFSGNILLKSMEGTALYMAGLMKQMFYKNLFSKLGALLCKKGEYVRKAMDYREVGGSVLLGISKPVIKAHGSSDARAIHGAIRQAIAAVQADFCGDIKENVSKMTLPREDNHVK